MSIILKLCKSGRSACAALGCVSYVFFSEPVIVHADDQALCNSKLAPGAIAVEDFSFGKTSYLCDCSKSYIWDENGSACIKRQLTGSDQPVQQPPDDSQETPARRKKARVITNNKKRVIRDSAVTAHRYCRRSYGRRLVNVQVKRKTFKFRNIS